LPAKVDEETKVDKVKAGRCAIRIRLKDQWRNTASSPQSIYSIISYGTASTLAVLLRAVVLLGEIFQNKHSTPSKAF
jgi:hypothetical protein